MSGESSTDRPVPTFAALLRQLRAEARLTQEELAYAAGLSPRSISDLERGVSRTARKDTALLLADALAIAGAARTSFLAAARGRAVAANGLAVRSATAAGVPDQTIRWRPGTDGRLLGEIELRNVFDAITAVSAIDGSVVTGIWLIRLAAPAGEL